MINFLSFIESAVPTPQSSVYLLQESILQKNAELDTGFFVSVA